MTLNTAYNTSFVEFINVALVYNSSLLHSLLNIHFRHAWRCAVYLQVDRVEWRIHCRDSIIMHICAFLCRTGVGIIILGICFCCIRRCCRKRRTKDGKKGLKGAVDLKSVQLLGSTYKDKVCIRCSETICRS